MNGRVRACFAACALLAGACATTRPYQREDLARPIMAVETTDPLDTLHEHVLGVREGAVGAMGGGGGGCGCH